MANSVNDFVVGELVSFTGKDSHLWGAWYGQLCIVENISPCRTYVRVRRISDGETGGWYPFTLTRAEETSDAAG